VCVNTERNRDSLQEGWWRRRSRPTWTSETCKDRDPVRSPVRQSKPCQSTLRPQQVWCTSKAYDSTEATEPWLDWRRLCGL